MSYIFLCQDSVDGIFTAVYDAFASGYGHKNIHLSLEKDYNYTLFQETFSVVPDATKASKVRNTLEQRLGEEFYETIWGAASADGYSEKLPLSKPDAVYETIVMALALPEGARVLEYLKEPCIHTVFLLNRGAYREGHHLLGFLRFQELYNGILFARIHPKNQVLHFVADHFADRFPLENFIIYDETHGIAAVHRAYTAPTNPSIQQTNKSDFSAQPADAASSNSPFLCAENNSCDTSSINTGKGTDCTQYAFRSNQKNAEPFSSASVPYFIVDSSMLPVDQLNQFSSDEKHFQALWLTFFQHIGIKERRNPKLQSQLLPKRYWAYTVEFASQNH